MKVVILAGGLGTRISEETSMRPKPMVEIGGKPIIWHIMKIYSHYGFNEFIICLGYKGYMIKEYFSNYFLHMSDVTINMNNNTMEAHEKYAEPWQVTLVDTGEETMTGGRLKRVESYIGKETFMMTYGDGVGNVNIGELLKFHKRHSKYATVTSVKPLARFGSLKMDDDGNVVSFHEKPDSDSWVSGGFFVLEPRILNYVKSDMTLWEREPMESLSADRQLMAYRHDGFWQPMDTLRDKNKLEELWKNGSAPWKVWR